MDLFNNGVKQTHFELLVKTFSQVNFKMSDRQLLKLVLGEITSVFILIGVNIDFRKDSRTTRVKYCQ